SHPLSTADQHVLCYAYSKTKRYNHLLVCLDQLEKNIRKGDRRTRLFGLSDATPTVRIMRAEAFIELGRYAEAIDEATKAVSWLKDENSDDLDMVFNAFAALSLARTLNGDEEGGRQVEKELSAIKPGLFSDYLNAHAFALARTRMGLKDYRGVIDAIEGDTTFTIKVFLDRLITGSFLSGVNNWVWAELPRAYMLSKALLETGKITEAKAGFERLLRIPQVKENGEIYWLLLNDCGQIATSEGLLEEALVYFSQAIEIVEIQRASINTEASKIGFVGDKQALYSRVVDLAYRLNRPLLAFEYIERSKSRALVDLLAARSDNGLLSARDSSTQELLDKYRNVEEYAGMQLPLDMASVDTERRHLTVATQARELRAKDPGLASLVTVTAIDADQMRRHILPDEALIEFFGLGATLYAVALNSKDSLVLRFDAKRLEDDIREFRALIRDRSPQTSQLAITLYQQLIKPFEAIIGNRNLLLVPHGALHYLPFSALNDGTNTLITRRSVRFLPSISAQVYLRPHKKQALQNVLIYGNPDLGDSRLDLPGAEEEAKLIASLLSSSEILTREKATKTSFKKLAGRFNYIHIASHGQFKSDSPLESRLLLAKDGEDDGALTVRELYDLRLDADLVTLSACETGLSKTLSGDDLVGLARGFFYAGSSNLVASLWEVSDEDTAILMKQFYNRLKAGTPKKEALRQAQLQLQKTHPAPDSWAAFYLSGEGI
ncbi:MAG TPA: CHAT domain-containing protein, partial [Nitrospira sp.]|nr:CHAT domain-containing protein [Nitrospira sp.]